MSNANPLWELIQAYMDDPRHRYPPKAADLARETGVSDQVISKWKMKRVLPTGQQLRLFAAGTGISYYLLLEAALRGRGYLPLNQSVYFDVEPMEEGADVEFLQPDVSGTVVSIHSVARADGGVDDEDDEALQAALRRHGKGGLERQADDQDADATAPDPEGPEGGA